jgi:hypothetical protein
MNMMNLAWGAPLLAAALLAAPVHAAYVTQHDGYRLAIRVVPRLGGFNNFLYQEARDAQCRHTGESQRDKKKWGWQQYTQRIADPHQSAQYTASLSGDELISNAFPAFPTWDIMTVATENQDHEGCAYGARRVMVTVTPINTMQAASCAFKIKGVAAVSHTDACKLDTLINANGEVPLEVQVSLSGQAVPVTLRSVIPEDVLVVSLGDSYSSGEGNPDIPKQTEKARWMDESCHRSIYAGPIRGAMRILNGAGELRNPRYQKALQAGAMTVVSFACSGGWVQHGLNGPYEGVKPRDDYAQRNTISDIVQEYKATGTKLGTKPLLPPQVDQLKKFLETQSPTSMARKTSIDLLVLGGGGNDVLFAPLIMAMVKQDITLADKTSIQQELDLSFGRLTTAYDSFGPRLKANRFDAGANSYDVLNVVPILYPDLMRASPSENCTGALDQHSTSLAGRVIGSLSSLFGKKISPDETEFMRANVLQRLNGVIVDVSARMGWHPLDPMPRGAAAAGPDLGPDADYRMHGWCRSANVLPYDEQQRWFRQPSESLAYQNNLNGSFHPTWQYNEAVTGAIIAKAFRHSVDAEPQWDAIKPAKVKTIGVKQFVPGEVQFTYVGADGAPLPQLIAGGNACIASVAGCQGMPGLRLGVHGAEADVFASAIHPTYLRKYPAHAIGHYKVDQQGPVVAFDKRPDLLAGTGKWLTERQLAVSSTDADSGVETLELVLSEATLPDVQQTVQRTSENDVKANVLFPSDGKFLLKVCARDGVGNPSAECGRPIALEVDTTPLRTVSIGAYGVQWWVGADSRNEPTIPIFPGIDADAQVGFAAGDASGVAVAPDCSAPVSDACALTLSAKGQQPWQHTRHTKTYRDAAGNTTLQNYWTIPAVPFDSKRKYRKASAWAMPASRAELTGALRAAVLVSPSLTKLWPQTPEASARLAALMARTSPADADAAGALFASASDQAIVAEWLNIMSGRLFVFAPGNTVLHAGCASQPANAGLATPFQVLYARTACATEARNNMVAR